MGRGWEPAQKSSDYKCSIHYYLVALDLGFAQSISPVDIFIVKGFELHHQHTF